MKKVKIMAIIALPTVFIVIVSGVFTANLSPYISVTQLKEQNMTQVNIQVYGQAVVDTIYYNSTSHIESFDLTDGINTVKVTYRGLINNLQNSTEVVAIGVYNGVILQAEKVLVKCPSKYEAAAKEE